LLGLGRAINRAPFPEPRKEKKEERLRVPPGVPFCGRKCAGVHPPLLHHFKMLGETADYSKLSANTGIDFDKIKAKYASRKTVGSAAEAARVVSGLEDKSRMAHVQYSNTVLEKYKVCQQCNGTGLRKTIYNFMTLESNCDVCEGEGVLHKPASIAEEAVDNSAEVLSDVVSDVAIVAEASPAKPYKKLPTLQLQCFDCGCGGVPTGHQGCTRNGTGNGKFKIAASVTRAAASDSEEEEQLQQQQQQQQQGEGEGEGTVSRKGEGAQMGAAAAEAVAIEDPFDTPD